MTGAGRARLVALACLASLVALAPIASAAPRREPLAVIDLGPPDDAAQQQVAAAAVTAGLAPLIDNGLERALAGVSSPPDAVQLAAAMAEAHRAFGALDCPAATTAAATAIGVSAARQAAGLDVPELARAWSYKLLCADRDGDIDAAMTATAFVRALGGAPEVPAAVLDRYPTPDTIVDRELLTVEIVADVEGAEIWIDFRRVGISPLRTQLTVGWHMVAASSGERRGWAAGTTVRTQPTVRVPTAAQIGPHAAIAARVAGWRGAMPGPTKLAEVMQLVGARIAIVRRGDRLEAWGRVGRSEPVRRLGGADGVGSIADAPRLAAMIKDRVDTWNDRAPDPDVPLLVEDPRTQRKRGERVDQPAQWWVYATVLGAIAAGAGVLYLHETRTNTQRIELSWP